MKFRTFLVAYLVVIISVSAFILAYPRNETKVEETKPAHFSVVWKGFAPSYSNQTPDYYVCINNLLSSVLQMKIDFRIENHENNSYYFMIDKYGTAPTDWNITPYYIGLINIDETKEFLYSNIARSKPTTIPQGRITESVPLVVRAYHESSYSTLYSEANFTVGFHFLDVTSTAWTVLDKDDFDDGTNQGWEYSSYASVIYYQQYRSWPCALQFYGGYYYYYGACKTIDTSGPYSERYLVFAVRPEAAGQFTIYINDQQVHQSDQSYSGGTWYQIAIPLPSGVSTSVRIYTENTYSWLDDVYTLAK